MLRGLKQFRKTILPTQGFTLLEVLVAIGIFSIVAMVSYSTLDTYLEQRERLTTHYAKLERLQRMFILLERDIQFSVPRAVRDGGDVQAAMTSGDGDILIAMTVAQADIQSATGISLRRVEWRQDGDELIRSEWRILDRDSQSKAAELLVSDEVTDMEINYFLYNPRTGVSTKSRLDPGEFPAGIEINITLKSGERYRRVFGIALAV